MQRGVSPDPALAGSSERFYSKLMQRLPWFCTYEHTSGGRLGLQEQDPSEWWRRTAPPCLAVGPPSNDHRCQLIRPCELGGTRRAGSGQRDNTRT
eukprot:414564-Prorocentrum_lima.AAC.1